MQVRLPSLTASTLKIVAIVGMTLCHVGIIFSERLPFSTQCILIACGGVTFPLMAYMIAEGYRHTSNIKRYATRLTICAIVSQIPYSLAFEPLTITWGSSSILLPFTGNVIWTLLLGLAILYAYDHIEQRPVFWAVFVCATAASVILDWGVLGPVMILLAYILPSEKERKAYPILLSMLALGLPALISCATGDLSQLPDVLYAFCGHGLALFLLMLYQGAQGLRFKYFFYVYYPAHLIILLLLSTNG
ncbi:MAG: hypothetical protein IKE43_00205 [Coriobacteriales bacterium]|nr:hypothetical protein [Coriobacteriales bacterium]